MRRTLGVTVFSGMLGVTVFGIFFTPVFYYVIRWLTARKQKSAAKPGHHPPPPMGLDAAAAPELVA
jgi:hypothetical protein